MFIEAVVRYRNVLVVPTLPVIPLVAPDKKEGPPFQVKGEQHPHLGPSRRTGTEFLHIPVAACLHGVNQWATECRALLPQHANGSEKGFSIGLIKPICPPLTRGMKLDRPARHTIMLALSCGVAATTAPSRQRLAIQPTERRRVRVHRCTEVKPDGHRPIPKATPRPGVVPHTAQVLNPGPGAGAPAPRCGR